MNSHDKPHEFKLIAEYMAPLTANFPGARLLKDDAAVMPSKPGLSLVVTTDMLVSEVHFLADTVPEYIASKALRVNLSDLSAMGADPVAYTLSLALPKDRDAWDTNWIQRFTEALSVEQRLFDVSLIGGDTVSTPGPLCLSITAFGYVAEGRELTRQGARDGDLLFVSGTIGDAALGLLHLKGEIDGLSNAFAEVLMSRHYRPIPRIELGKSLADLAHAAIDISDGLTQDLAHICRTSNVSATIDMTTIPLSESVRQVLSGNPDLWSLIMTGGDDYELLFTAPPENEAKIMDAAKASNTTVTIIGKISKINSSGTLVFDENEGDILAETSGYRHF